MTLAMDLVRAGQDASVVLLFGCHAFRLIVARRAFAASIDRDATANARAAIDRDLCRLEGAGLMGAFTTGLLWLWLTAADMSGTPPTRALSGAILGTVLGHTRFGQIAQLRFILAALLGALLVYRNRARRHGRILVFDTIGAVLATALLASLAWTGHAGAATGNERIWQLCADVVHLLAAGAWLGALPGLALVLLRSHNPKAGMWPGVAHRAAQRFSILGIASVSILVASGLVSAWYLVGDIPAFIGTPYGRLLLIKLGLLALMLALATINRYKLTPRLAAHEVAAPACRQLLRNTLLETLLGLVVLGVVGALVNTTPAAHEQPVWPFPYTFDLSDIEITPGLKQTLAIAALFLLGGVIELIWGLRNRVLWMMLVGPSLIVAGIVLSAQVAVVEAYPTSYFRSPAPYDAVSIAHGQSLYVQSCAPCHGRYGYGDGALAASLPIKPADLTGEHLIHHGVGTLFWWISHGIAGTPMPAFADGLDETQRWDVINFLRAQEEAEQSNQMTAGVEPFRPVVAPDFAFQRPGGVQQTLSAERGQATVLLVLYTMPGSLLRLRALQAALPEFERLGTRVIAMPMSPQAAAAPSELSASTKRTILVDPNPDAVETYTLYRRVPTGEGVLPIPQHMELLIDRAGYLRARSLSDDESGWRDLPSLLKQIERLNVEPPHPPATALGHVH